MAVLSNVDIDKIIMENRGIIIMNKHEKNLTAPGYDFTIGFIRDSDSGKKPEKVECIYDAKLDEEYLKEEFFNNCQLQEEYEKSKDGKRYEIRYRYKLLPGKRYLVISEEYIALLRDYMATLHSRGSYALKGIIVASTTIDPNYRGFIYASLINCSKEPVYIKEHNQFVTMVIQTVTTATDKHLAKTEGGMPMDAEQTLNGRFSNVCEETVRAAKTYRTDAWKKIEREFEDRYAAFQSRTSNKKHFVNWLKIKELFVDNVMFKREFWIGVGLLILLLFIFFYKGIDAVIEFVNDLLK